MYSKFILLTLVSFVIWVNFVAECKPISYNADQIEGEDDPYPPERPRGGFVSRSFTAWMKFLGSFWKDGNWESGGPDNFPTFVGEQVRKLVKMLDEAKKKK